MFLSKAQASYREGNNGKIKIIIMKQTPRKRISSYDSNGFGDPKRLILILVLLTIMIFRCIRN